MVENTARSIAIDPSIFARPKASGAYMRVTMGVSSIPKICEIIGTDARVRTS
jgi:hypothetical protein